MFRPESFERNVRRIESREAADESYPVATRTASQIGVLAEVLSRALRDEPRFIYVIPNEETRHAMLPWFFASAIRVGEAYGETFTSAHGAAIWIRPGGAAEVQHILRGELQRLPFKLRTSYIRRCVRVGVCLERIHERFAGRPHWYLLTLGVDPYQERDTIAPALITPVLSRADSEGVSCYLETFRESDLPFYKEHGFRIEGSGRIAGSGPNFWIMMRTPQS